ncbi:MAG: hypothetical protein M3276_00605 [Actinomycetota bacterium]|nr:hypothetical protein [Actinomycetota bacterium]
MTLGGRRVPLRRPRMRRVDERQAEITLESYETFASSDLLAEGIVARMLAGLFHPPLPGDPRARRRGR